MLICSTIFHYYGGHTEKLILHEATNDYIEKKDIMKNSVNEKNLSSCTFNNWYSEASH